MHRMTIHHSCLGLFSQSPIQNACYYIGFKTVSISGEIVYGEEALGNDAKSVAECGDGKVVMRCHSFGIPYATDGMSLGFMIAQMKDKR